ncbi:MAG: hypothetical protein V4650_09335 [Pseudomonadota bacterium]
MNTSATMDEFKNTASSVAGEAKSTSSAIGNEVKNFIADLEEMVTSKSSGALDIGQIKSDISSRIADYKVQARAAGEQAITQVKQKAEGVNSYVHEDPWKAIGVSFAVGLLLGVVVARR